MVGNVPTPGAHASETAGSRIVPGSPLGKVTRKVIAFAGRQLIVETGKLAGQIGRAHV